MPLRLDARRILLDRPRPLSLKTYPVRRKARKMLEWWARACVSTAVLHARVPSPVIGAFDHQRVQDRQTHRRASGDASVERRQVPEVPGAVDASHQGVEMHVTVGDHFAVRPNRRSSPDRQPWAALSRRRQPAQGMYRHVI